MSETDKEYIAGFFEAEGYIMANPAPNDRYRIGYALAIGAGIGQKDIAYIAGYFDGEGYLCNAISIEKNADVGHTIKLRVRLATKDYDILEKIKEVWQTQDIIAHTIKKRRSGVKEINITDKTSLRKFLEIYTPLFWGVKKAQAEIMLNEILTRVERGEHLTKKGFIEIMGYIDKMNSTKGHNRGRYNQQYFKSLWGNVNEESIVKRMNPVTTEELNTIKGLREQGLFIEEIAQKTGRTYGSIRHTLTQLSKGAEFQHGRLRIKTKIK